MASLAYMLNVSHTCLMKIDKIIKAAGGTAAVARLFGIKSQAVSQWKQVPTKRVLKMEEHLNGSITRYQMRPEIYGKKAA